jgi:S-DNA-T family DNA segregation ATPase FtsK/SpoIIIE
MAASTKRASGRGASAPIVAYERKQEVLGLVMMTIAFLIFLALASYTPTDDRFLSAGQGLSDAIATDTNRAQNALGLVGAALAFALIPNFLGYPVMVWTLLLFSWGYLFFRARPSLYLPMYTTLGMLGTFEVSTLFGWIGAMTNLQTINFSGGVGLGIADWMIRVFGGAGSFFLITALVLITGMLIIDRDLQRSMDRIEEMIGFVFYAIKTGFLLIKKEVVDNRQTRVDRLKRGRLAMLEDNALLDEAEAAATAARPSAPAVGNVSGVHTYRAPTPPPPAEEEDDDAPPPPSAAVPRAKTLAPEGPVPTLNDLFSYAGPEAEPPAGASAPALADFQRMFESPRAHVDDLSLTVQQPVREEKTEQIKAALQAQSEQFQYRYRFPSVELLDKSDDSIAIDRAELEENKQILLDKLATYNIQITDIKAIVGPTITMYELTPAPGVKISKITALENDLAMAMAARGIRMIAPIPGKSAIGVEIPNRHRELVRLRDLIATKRFSEAKMRLPFPIGKTIEGQVYIQDVASMPHLLIAGATGAGKSVCLNTLITGLLYACHPNDLKFVMIDPKKIELQQYGRIVDHYIAMPSNYEMPIITDVSQALGVLRSCEREMEFRYNLLQKAMVRGLFEYNEKFKQGELDDNAPHRHLPYIVVVVDELADLMLTAGKEIEGPIARLAQMSRAVGIHLVLATQRPSVDVITGLIKANFPARIAFQVASKIDSRTILDANGAEGLVGNGDMLFMKGSQIIRLQGPYVSVDEVDYITEFIATQQGPGPYALPSIEDTPELEVVGGGSGGGGDDLDDLFKEAARIIVQSQQGSVSLLQRKLSIGYTRSARIVDQLERAGIVGPFEGSKARAVLIQDETELEEILANR